MTVVNHFPVQNILKSCLLVFNKFFTAKNECFKLILNYVLASFFYTCYSRFCCFIFSSNGVVSLSCFDTSSSSLFLSSLLKSSIVLMAPFDAVTRTGLSLQSLNDSWIISIVVPITHRSKSRPQNKLTRERGLITSKIIIYRNGSRCMGLKMYIFLTLEFALLQLKNLFINYSPRSNYDVIYA